MPRSGYLPDVSGVFGSWRDVYKKALSSGNWDDASLALHNMNGALDDEYRLPINSEMWEKKKDAYVVWKCNNCTTIETKIINKGEEDEYTKEIEVPTCSKHEDIRTYTQQCDPILKLLVGTETREMWVCPKCNHADAVSNVETQLRKHKSPHYRGCIYDEPTKPLTGLAQRRGGYPARMEAWCRNYSIELEHQLAIYRLEYVQQHDGEDMADSYHDKGGT